MPPLAIQAPYLLFLGSEKSPTYAKTAAGLAHWRPELCMGQLRLTPDTLDLGLPDYDVTEAVANGAQTLVIGTAVVGGGIPEAWIQLLVDALDAGLDVAAGVHTRLSSIDRLVEAATRSGRKLIDVRVPPPQHSRGNRCEALRQAPADRRNRLCFGEEIHRSRPRARDEGSRSQR